MLHFALIGEKLGHSLSVPIHEALFDILGLSADYRLAEIPRDDFDAQVTALMRQVNGFNITIPYKQAVMHLLDGIDPQAQAIGAVNTVTVGQTTRGYNTDMMGFTNMLRHHGIDPAGQPCYCLGTGGASKAVRAALTAMGAGKVVMVSRHPQGEEIGYDRLQEEFRGVLVNCTPAGMYPHPEGCPIAPDRLDSLLIRAAGVADLIYNPAETVLSAAARRHGIPVCTGLYMLVDQAMEAEKLWLGHELPQGITDRILPLIHL